MCLSSGNGCCAIGETHATHFAEYEPNVRYGLESPKGSDAAVDAELRKRGLSLRVVVKEIPSVFGSFFE